jgi:hypothetical protein
MIAYAARASVKKRTTDWFESAPARLSDIVEGYISREDIAASTQSTTNVGLLPASLIST